MNNGIEGDVQSRMDAFRGNPQALAQRYAQNQQLIDLLALQKLKSEKEAAARQMQMQAGQGQMPTIAQQREQELMGMAKQDVAQRVGAVGQQQAQQQQKNLQQALQGGIAQAPAPNMMPPQAMASGGIVAFAGPDGSEVKGEMPEWIRNAPEWLKAQWREADATGNVRALQGIKQRAEQLMQTSVASPVRAAVTPTAPAQAAPAQVAPAQAAAGLPPAAPGVPPGQQRTGAVPAPGGGTDRDITPPQLAPEFLPYGQSRAPRPDDEFGRYDQSTAPASVIARQRAAGGAPASGIAKALPQAAPAQQPSDLQGILSRGLEEDIQASPEARAAAERAAYDKQFGPLYKQQQELSQQGIAQLQQRMAQQPKKDPLTEFLRGMSSQRTLGMALGAGGAGMSAAQREEFKQQAELEDQLQRMRETGLSAQVTQETARHGAGKEAAKAAAEARKAAMQYGAGYMGAVLSADARREIAERDAIIREQNRELGLDAKISNMILQRVKDANTLIATKYKYAHVDAKQAADMKAEMNASERKIYAEFGKTPPETAAPTAGPAIPPPPKDAVRLKGAK